MYNRKDFEDIDKSCPASAAVKTLRTSQWWTEQVNSVHPLTAGYEAISYPFESWLRSL